MLYYTVENSNGVSGYEVSPNGELWWPEESPVFVGPQSASRDYLDTAMSSETKLYICAYFIAEPAEETVCVRIGLFDEQTGERIQTNDISLELPGDVGMAGVELADGAVYLSPISIQMDLAALGVEGESAESVTLYYTDGSEYVVEDEAGFVMNRTYSLLDMERDVVTYTFNRIVDTDSIVSVEIDGAMYE